MNRKELIAALTTYQTDFSAERLFKPRFLSLLRNFHNCYERVLLSGHMTASAWILDNSGHSVVLVHHKKLNRWLQPGGHADGEEDIVKVASTEAFEETGLTSLSLYSEGIFDIDIHLIPGRKEVQSHFHFDIRFLFVADKQEPFTISDESNELTWVPIDAIAELVDGSQSIMRMVLKSNLIFKRKL